MRDRKSWPIIFALLVSLTALPFASSASAQIQPGAAAPAPDLPSADMPPPNTVVPDFVLDNTDSGDVAAAPAPDLSSSDGTDVAGATVEAGAAPAPDLPSS